MHGNFTNAGLFLVKALFESYLLILIVRLILAYAKANYFNPITRLIIKLTLPLVNPLRRIIPNYKGIEFSTLVLILFFELVKILLLCVLTIGVPSIFVLIKFAVIDMVLLLLKTFFYAILFQAILSWFKPAETAATQLLQQITSPVLRPLQRVVPPMGGFDITPIPALLILQLLIILLS